MHKFRFAIVITAFLFIVTVILGIYALAYNPVLVPVYFSLFTGITAVYLAQLIRESLDERQTESLRAAARVVLSEELKRNFCTVDLFPGSLLSTVGWDNVARSGLALRFYEKEFKPLLTCYSAIEFYNHDVSHGNMGEQKQDRVRRFISEALLAIKATTPTLEQCCKEILPEWTTPGKLDDACARRRKQSQENMMAAKGV